MLSNHLLRQAPTFLPYLVWSSALLFVVPANLHFYLVFPEPQPAIQRRPWLLAILYAVPVAFLVFLVPALLRLDTPCQGAGCVEGIRRVRDLFIAYFFLGLLSCAQVVVSLIHSRAHAASVARKKQVQVVMIGALATFFLALPAILGLTLTLTRPAATSGWPAWVFPVIYGLTVLATLALPASMAVAVLRYKLWAVDTAFHRSLRYMVFSSALLGVNFGVIGILGVAFGRVVKPTSPEGLVAFTLIVAAAVGPLRRLANRTGDRLYARESDAPRRTLSSFSRDLTSLRPLDEVTRGLSETLARAFGAQFTLVVLRGEGNGKDFHLASSSGLPAEKADSLFSASLPLIRELAASARAPFDLWAAAGRTRAPEARDSILRELATMEIIVPIERNGSLLGWIALGEKRSGTLYSGEDRGMLAWLANHASSALVSSIALAKNEALNRELQEKNGELEETNAKLRERNAEIEQLQRRILSENDGLKNENERLKGKLAGTGGFEGIVGAEHGMKDVLDKVRKVAPTGATVLIVGETGTGKELIAKAIHDLSARKDGPFETVNCAALPEGVIQNELFGHDKGGYTGATEQKPGLFERANGGTVLLDEIGDIPMTTQIALLRVIQEREVLRVGGSEKIPVDVRVIAATHRDLAAAVREGRFREDLLYRLKVVTIEVPPLRERTTDIRALALHFTRKHATAHGKTIRKIDDDVIERFRAYPWPGNVRQMENIIEQMVVLATGDTLTLEDIPADLQAAGDSPLASRTQDPGPPQGTSGHDPITPNRGTDDPDAAPAPARSRAHKKDIREIERARLVEVLARTGGNQSEAARLLGIPRTTFRHKLRRYGIVSDEDE